MSAPFKTSTVLDHQSLRHGFFGRQGGVSTGDFAALNLSESSSDEMNHLASNRAQATAALGFSPEALAQVRQTHSTIALTLDAAPPHPRPQADALVTNRPGLLLGILTADCAPVLLADTSAGVIAAAHAGWKGAINGIIANTIAAMVALGATPAHIAAAIGPTISGVNYEVGPDFAANLMVLHPGAAGRLSRPGGGREHFDLPGFVADQLAAAGIGRIEGLGLCTYAAPKHYFSHRRATHEGRGTGRQIAMIGLLA